MTSAAHLLMIEFFELFIIKIDLPRNEIVILLSSIKIKSDDFFRDVKIVKSVLIRLKHHKWSRIEL